MKCFEDGSSFFDFQGDAGMAWEPGQSNFKLATNCDYIHLGQLTQAKVSVSVGS